MTEIFFVNGIKLVAIIIIILISSILLLFNWTNLLSESHIVQAQPATHTTTTTTTSLQDNIGDPESNAENVAKKFRDTKGEKIPNQYIVVLKDDFLASTKSSADKAAAQGAELRHIYSHALHGFAVKVPNEKALVGIMKNPEVDYVQPDVKMEAFAQTLPTGVNRVDGDLSSARSGNGDGTVNVDIAILDTGIQLSHPDLNVFKHVTFVSRTSTGNDDNGHGTSVAGIAAAKDDSAGVVGIAPGARLWAVKVLANNGVGMSSDIIKGIDYVTAHANEIDVVNLSFGGEGTNDALRTAISRSVADGVTYVAAAGNQGRDASSFVPAGFPEVITVSAIADYDGKCGGLSSVSTSSGKDDTFASFSNHGSVIDLAAPGVQIKTTARGSSYTSSFTGTSASAPHVTGAAALYKVEHPSASPSEIKNALGSLGSLPSTICDGNGHGYFTGDKDSIAEPLLYIAGESTLPEPDCTGNLPISSATASGSEATHPPTHAIDNNFGTRWAADPDFGSWIRVDLGSTQNICSVDIAWYNGNARQYHFVIATSTNGIGFSNVFSGDSTGTTSSPEKYVFPAIDARYVKVTINGNTQNNAASIHEIDVFASSSLLAELPPVANSQVVTTTKNTPKAITLTATDPNNDLLTYSLVTQPAHGTITGVAPSLMYNPTTGYVGPDSFKFKVNDGIADSNNATVSITVQDLGVCTTNLPINSATASGSEATHPPTHAIDNNFGTRWAADPDFGSWIRVDLGLTQNICSVDIAWYNGMARQYHFVIATSIDGNTFTNVFSGDSSGTTTSSEKYFIPATDARYIRVTINGNTQNNAASIFELDIFGSSSGNSPPVANNQAVAVNKNTAKSVTLTAIDPNNDPLTYSIVTPPAHGTLTGTAPNLIYNPVAGYVGPDSFTFRANDGIADSNIATVSITVQDLASCTTNLPISGATASGSESTHPPTHAIDNNFGTRWAADPDFGSWIRVDLGSTKNICSVDIAWYNGFARQYHFIIATSTDGNTFTNVFSGDSSGTTAGSEKYIIPAIDARYVKVTINGNTQNNAASIYELDIFGSLSSLTAYHHEPSLSLSGP